MPEVIIVVVALLVGGAVILLPLWRRPAAETQDDAAVVRHRVALESLRDVEADRRAGSLDDEAYRQQIAEAEARAAQTEADLAAAPEAQADPEPRRETRPLVVAAGAIVAIAVGVGIAIPAIGLANGTVVNQALAEAEAAEDARQARIDELLVALESDATDPQTLSDLADAYLAGSTAEDLQRGAVALQALIGLEPERADAYERIMGAYLRAGDAADARAAHDAYADLDTADPVEVAFFGGLIALREGNEADARAAFDRFLELAPDDPRAGMIEGLRDEAGGG